MFLEIKKPFAYLSKGDNNVLFFDELDDLMVGKNMSVISIDNIPDNFPRFAVGTHAYHDAIKRVKDMVTKEGWELVQTSVKELEELID